MAAVIAVVVGLRVLYCIIVEVDSGYGESGREQKGTEGGHVRFRIGQRRECRSARIYTEDDSFEEIINMEGGRHMQ